MNSMSDTNKELASKIHLEFHKEQIKAGNYTYMKSEFENIRDKLASFTPHRSDIKQYLEKNMQIDLYEQMLKNNAVEYNDIANISKFIFYHMKKLCAPSRDKMLDDSLDNLFHFINKNLQCKITCMVKVIQVTSDVCEVLENDLNKYLKSDRAVTDFEILQTEGGQKWLKKRNSD